MPLLCLLLLRTVQLTRGTDGIAAKSLDDLRERLRSKIEMLAQNRKERPSGKKRLRENPKNKEKGPAEKKSRVSTESSASPAKQSKKQETPSEVDKSDPVASAPKVADVISKLESDDLLISSLQFGNVKAVDEVDVSLRPKARKDIHQLLKQAQKKQDYLKKLKSSEEGQVWLYFVT